MVVDEAEYHRIENALMASIKRFPNCTIANCDCDSRHGEWKPGCHCLCHFRQVQAKYGENDELLLKHFEEMAKEGMSIGNHKERNTNRPTCFGKPGKIGQIGCIVVLCPHADDCMKTICSKCQHREGDFCLPASNGLCHADKPSMFLLINAGGN